VQRADGHVVRAADEVKTDDLLRVRLADGELRATVQEPR
jgi:exodeoxyribonuclease VII large subunit